MFCSYCGAELPSDASFCPKCGKQVVTRVETSQTPATITPPMSNLNLSTSSAPSTTTHKDKKDECSPVLQVLSVIFPIVGFILWAVWVKKYPKKAKAVGMCALGGFLGIAITKLLLF